MSLPGILRRLFANDGYGPRLRPEIIPPAYEICEFYYFRHPTLRPGFQPAQGGLIENAAETYPEAWEYLQTEPGQLICKTEAEWQAMTTATWATLADGTEIGWDGIGGAPFYVQDLAAGSLRLPDLRGMYMEAAGFDSLDVGGVHGDMIRNITGEIGFPNFRFPSQPVITGAYYSRSGSPAGARFSGSGSYSDWHFPGFDASRVIPVGAANKPRAWSALPCVYLGAAA